MLCRDTSRGRRCIRVAMACLLGLFTFARIACLLQLWIKTSYLYYSIWGTPKSQIIMNYIYHGIFHSSRPWEQLTKKSKRYRAMYRIVDLIWMRHSPVLRWCIRITTVSFSCKLYLPNSKLSFPARHFIKVYFHSKGTIDKVNLTNILHNKLVRSKVPIYFQEQEPAFLSYTYTKNISRNVFNLIIIKPSVTLISMIIVIHLHRVTANLQPFVISLMAMSIRSLVTFASSRTETLDVYWREVQN